MDGGSRARTDVLGGKLTLYLLVDEAYRRLPPPPTGWQRLPSAADIKALLETVGIEAEEDRLSKLISELEGKDINEVIAEGASKLASVPSGGAAASASAGGAAAAAGGDAPAAEEKKEEAKEESDDDMGFGLFD